ncbi:Protein ripply3 [Anas platyrhynchos]|uniref:Protein ripply3 n=1 Tax=Anas platyrhynchos TaxID=8839 RepID=R0M0M6_ANAPL|nr:Protein ripply3 [Anas platyrhynchos]
MEGAAADFSLRATVDHVCHCSRDTQQHSLHPGEQPQRLYLPKSKSQKFLNNIGEKVLASFPVQATIHFYNDDTDSEEDEEETSSA